MDLKNSHHYVNKNYLNGWAVDGVSVGVFYISSKKRAAARGSAAGIFVEKHFYKFSPVSNDDLLIFKAFIGTFDQVHRKNSVNLVNEFVRLSSAHSFLSKYSWLEEAKSGIALLECNTLEDMHTEIENRALPTLKELWAGRFGVLEDVNSCIHFSRYLAHQALRNKGVKDNTLKKFKELKSNNVEMQDKLHQFWEKHWSVIMLMVGDNFGANIFKAIRGGGFEFLINDTDSPFITSDRPVNNMHSDAIGRSDAPEFMDLYYPLSPRMAFFLPEHISGYKRVRAIKVDEVEDLNRSVAKASFESIVATTSESLERYKKLALSKK